MNQNGYESQNSPGFGQAYITQQGGYTPPVTGPYFASNQPNGYQNTGTPGYQPPQQAGYQASPLEYQMSQNGGLQNNMSGYQSPVTGGYQAAVPGYQTPQTSGFPGAGYFSQPSSAGSYTGGQGSVSPDGANAIPGYGTQGQYGYYGGQINSGYSPYMPSGTGYATIGRPTMATGGSYIPPTPYSTSPNTTPDYRKMQVGYQQGYNSISQMGRSAQSTVPQKTASQQIPLNGGGYAPERVPVRRQPFEVTDIMIYAAGGILVLLFVLAMFVFDSTPLKILFMLLAGGTTAALWIKPLTAENKRLCYTIISLALCIVTVVSLITSAGKSNSGGNDPVNNNQQVTGNVQQSTTPTPAMQIASGSNGNSTGDIYGTGAVDSAEEDEATKQRLYLFFQYWNANRLDEMLTVCAPSWTSKQESPKSALFQILKNRTPINFEIMDLKGTSQDKSRQIILKCEIDRHTGTGTTVWYQLSVIMLKEGDQWYVDPLSIQTNEIEETPDPNITPTPAPTPEPHYDANTVLYYNPDGGSMYHADPNCQIINPKYLPLKGQFTFGQINDPKYEKLEPCNVCNAPLR